MVLAFMDTMHLIDYVLFIICFIWLFVYPLFQNF